MTFRDVIENPEKYKVNDACELEDAETWTCLTHEIDFIDNKLAHEHGEKDLTCALVYKCSKHGYEL